MSFLFSPMHMSSKPSSQLRHKHVSRPSVETIDSGFSSGLRALPFNDPPGPDLETQRRTAIVAGIELGAVAGQGAAVVHVDIVALFGLARAFDWGGDFDLEAGRNDKGE